MYEIDVTGMKPVKTYEYRNAVFTRQSEVFDEVLSGRVLVDKDNNIITALGPEGFEFDLKGYDVEIL